MGVGLKLMKPRTHHQRGIPSAPAGEGGLCIGLIFRAPQVNLRDSQGEKLWGTSFCLALSPWCCPYCLRTCDGLPDVSSVSQGRERAPFVFVSLCPAQCLAPKPQSVCVGFLMKAEAENIMAAPSLSLSFKAWNGACSQKQGP